MADRITDALAGLRRALDGVSERVLAAALLATIAVVGSLIGFVTYLLPHPAGTNFVAPSIAFVISIFAGVVLWARRRSASWTTIGILVALGSVVVTVVMLSVPGRSAAYVTYYVWLGIFAFYFLRPAWALAQIALIAALYALAVSVDPPQGPVEVWVNGVATTLGVGLLVLALRTRIAGLVARLETEASTDELTGLPNRRAFYEQFRRELQRGEREGSDVSLAVIDLDQFKQLNDTVGHLAGDRALRALAGALQATVRPSDWAARLGGDEFAVLLPGAGRNDAAEIAGRIVGAANAELAGVRCRSGSASE